jgi:BirA family biotin operon repressor/biotin-[acetyl-CoA-carboxylase] ligase
VAEGANAALLVQAIRERLTTRWLARELHGLDETDSTNRVATELALGGASHGTTVLAEQQNAGRGRHGRSFFSPAGRNLYTTIVLRPEAGRVEPSAVLAAGIAVAETAAEFVGDRARVSIKWPNDVQIDGLKTSGILVEGTALGSASAAVLGIGVNLNMARDELPEEFRGRATSLAEACGKAVDRAAFAAHLYGTLEAVLDLHEQQGFEGLRTRFDGFFRMKGAAIRVADLEGTVQAEGRALGVGSDGSLRLEGQDGREQRILAGDVTVVKEASA